MKTRNLSTDYLPFRKYHNGIFKLHLAIILSIITITRFFILLVIPNRTHNKVKLSPEHTIEKMLKLFNAIGLLKFGSHRKIHFNKKS